MNKIHRFFIGLKEEQTIDVKSIIGWIISIITLLSAINSSFFFIFQLKLGILDWLRMNTCAPVIFLFFVGYLCSSPLLMTITSLFMVRYGTLGLFFFSWQGFNIIAQIGHLLMTLTAIYTFYCLTKERAFRTLICGLVIGIIISVSVWFFIEAPWFNEHPGLLENLFQGQYSN